MLAKVSQTYRPLVEANDDVALGSDLITDIAAHPVQFPIAVFSATMAAFAPIQTTYVGLVNAAKGGDAAAVAARNTYRTNTWLPEVDKIAVLVDNQASGDPSIILLSGFHATKTTRDAATLPPAMTLEVNSSGNGTLEYSSKTKVDAHEFLLVGVEDGHAVINENGDVITIVTNQATTIHVITTHNKKGRATGLVSGLKMLWGIRAKNAAGSGLLSKLIKLIIQ